MHKIYLDFNATTPVLEDIKLSVEKIISNRPLNASSSHHYGQIARGLIEDCRDNILNNSMKGLSSRYNLIFTPSGTISNNIIIQNFANDSILVSSIEHSSILKTIKQNKQTNLISVDQNGFINMEDLESKIRQFKPKLISIIYAHNEIGVIQDMKLISKICKENNILLHTDASQAFGKIDCEFEDFEPDFITISSHKIYGMQGSSAIIYNNKIKLNPIFFGGGQENFILPGTENIASILSFSFATNLITNNILIYKEKEYLIQGITNIVLAKNYFIPCLNVKRLPNTIMISKENSNSSIEVLKFDALGFMVSNGSACSSGLHQETGILKLIEAPEGHKQGIRISIGITTTEEEISKLLKIL